MVRILDIDLDLFQTEIADNCPRHKKGRLDENPTYPNIKLWPVSKLVDFLRRCGLSKEKPLKRYFIEHHDEVFFKIRDLITKNKITPEIEIYHADAHADLGCGDASSHYILKDLIHQPLNNRFYPKLRYSNSSKEGGDLQGLSEGNYLLFMIACCWLKKIVYIHHEARFDDIPLSIFPKKVPGNGEIRLPIYNQKHLDKVNGFAVHLVKRSVKADNYGAKVVFERILCDKFKTNIDFDFAFVCKSPTYTLSKADDYLPIINEYIATS